MVHALVSGPGAEGEAWGHSCYEGDRSRFLGRGRTARQPALLEATGWWEGAREGSAGATLDPVVVLGQEIHLAPHSSVQFAIVTLAGEHRQGALDLARRFNSWSAIERAFTRAAQQRRTRTAPIRPARRCLRTRPPAAFAADIPAPRRAAAIRQPWLPIARDNPGCGRTASPAITRSCCCVWPKRRTVISCLRCCWPIAIGGAAAC